MATFNENTIIDATDFLTLPRGTTAQRPGSPAIGHLRFNTSFNVAEYWNGTAWIDAESGLRAGLNGSTQALAAPSAEAILAVDPNAPSGDYWIQPSGQTAYKVYCEMSMAGGAWVLVGAGQAGRADNAAGYRDWWRSGGDTDGAYATGLRHINRGHGSDITWSNSSNASLTRNPRYMPDAWIQALCGPSWNNMQFLCNRIEAGDSWHFYGSPSQNFSWVNFEQSAAPFSLTSDYYEELWMGGTRIQSNSGTAWTDTLNYGGAIVNEKNRTFTWSWGGHSSPQLTGWSAGAAYHFPGATIANEGHSIQYVNCYVKSI